MKVRGHSTIIDPEAQLYKKSPGASAMLCFMGHTLMENRSGLIVQPDLTQADVKAERRAALDLIHRHSARINASTYTSTLTLGRIRATTAPTLSPISAKPA